MLMLWHTKWGLCDKYICKAKLRFSQFYAIWLFSADTAMYTNSNFSVYTLYYPDGQIRQKQPKYKIDLSFYITWDIELWRTLALCYAEPHYLMSTIWNNASNLHTYLTLHTCFWQVSVPKLWNTFPKAI